MMLSNQRSCQRTHFSLRSRASSGSLSFAERLSLSFEPSPKALRKLILDSQAAGVVR